MTEHTQERLDELIACPKTIVDPPRREMREERGSRRNEMRLVSADGKDEFVAYMRINVKFEENFSIGLDYCPKDVTGRFCLLRCNGPHGEWTNDLIEPHPHFGYHVHRANADNMERGMKSEAGAEVTKEYASYPEALKFFLKICNVADAQRHFPGVDQMNLFEAGQ